MPKAKIPNGCVMLARKIEDSAIWYDKPSWWLKVWVYILMRVNHEERKGIDRGQGFFTRENIYHDCRLRHDHVKANSVDNVIRWLKSTTQITTRKTTRGIVVTVCQYDKYQDMANYKNETRNDTPDDTGTTQERHRNEMLHKNSINSNNSKKKSKRKKRQTKPHGEYRHVKLTKEEVDRLVKEWGAQWFGHMIKVLDEGMERKGYKYPNCNLAIRDWEKRERLKMQPGTGSPQGRVEAAKERDRQAKLKGQANG